MHFLTLLCKLLIDIDIDGSAAYHPSEKAELFSTFFSSKENQNDVALPPVCFPEPILSSFAFKPSELLKYFSDLDTSRQSSVQKNNRRGLIGNHFYVYIMTKLRTK